jgi:ABC-type transport system involved in Fe-S cluster assembly fused permease/ATPase subunit
MVVFFFGVIYRTMGKEILRRTEMTKKRIPVCVVTHKSSLHNLQAAQLVGESPHLSNIYFLYNLGKRIINLVIFRAF